MMSGFEQVSLRQVAVLCEVLSSASLLDREFVEKRYRNSARNFEETVSFLGEMGLISVRRKQIHANPTYTAFLRQFSEAKDKEFFLTGFITRCLLGSAGPFFEPLAEFASLFRLVGDQYEFAPDNSQKLKYSGIRNLLMELGILRVSSDGRTYVVSDEHSLAFSEMKTSGRVPPEEFAEAQRKRKRIGDAAEHEVLAYEKERLRAFPELAERIEHTAAKDVAAGYDIKSFTVSTVDGDDPRIRYVEVKAVSPIDYKFYWTRNEIKKARQSSNSYFLYLLPVVGSNRFDMESLKIVGNPYTSVYENQDAWVRTEELLSFALPQDTDKDLSPVGADEKNLHQ